MNNPPSTILGALLILLGVGLGLVLLITRHFIEAAFAIWFAAIWFALLNSVGQDHSQPKVRHYFRFSMLSAIAGFVVMVCYQAYSLLQGEYRWQDSGYIVLTGAALWKIWTIRSQWLFEPKEE
jgi:Ca2+/Na+ antiporter